MRATALVLAAFALSCASAAPPQAPPLPTPPDLAAAVRSAEQRGHALYLHDQAAWHATDAAMGKQSRFEGELIGWITTVEPGDTALRVLFLSEPSPGVYASRLDVTAAGAVVENDPALVLPEEDQALARARALAIASRKRQCSETLNTIVLRDASAEIHVYLLAATKQPDEVILAGHDLARVRADGREILAWRALSNSCLALKKRRGAAGLMVSHVLDPAPTEAHVFTSLNYGMPVFVATERGSWKVEGDRILLIEERTE